MTPEETPHHLTPRGDLREHDLSKTCWCGPEIRDDEEGVLIIHHAMDQRELYETEQLKRH